MNTNQLVKHHERLSEQSREILRKKNHDYSGGRDDALVNLRACEILGVPGELGVLSRCMDKFQRLATFVARGELAVEDESFRDSILDVINYMVLLDAMICTRRHHPDDDRDEIEK